MRQPLTNLELRTHHSVREIEPQVWDGLAGEPALPHLRWAFLDALEQTGCVRPEVGWMPAHLSLWREGQVLAVAPAYIKGNSEGEFVFDHGWAQFAYQRLGVEYYPKLVIASPFLLLTALLVKLDSPGPVFYIQERMGLDAVPFKMIKFRSMRVDAEAEGPGWTRPDDPRRTKLGSIMRRFNLDELPQLINVLVGDMSLVGPRPERPVYVEQFRQSIPRYMDRHREKAGITGWAQVNGLRGDTSIIERTKYDLWYIENWSLALDIKILIRTVAQWILGTNRNAY